MADLKKKEIPYERILFFSDAIVAIAITLLALDLRLEVPRDHHLSFQDLLLPWKNYLAFFLSFINIAGFWRVHHQMYIYIHKMNERTMIYNICWLFFIVTLPFSTSVLSTHFGDSAAIFLYSANILALSILQNTIWDNADIREGYIDTEKVSDGERERFRIMFNLDMINGVLCIILCFFVPKIAFFLLFLNYLCSFLQLSTLPVNDEKMCYFNEGTTECPWRFSNFRNFHTSFSPCYQLFRLHESIIKTIAFCKCHSFYVDLFSQ